SPMLWEHELEKAMMDVDAQSTASSDAALMIGLDRMSAAGTDNNTMSGVSSESGQQPDSNEDQLYAETPDDEDGKDTEELYQAYMKVTEDNEDRSKDSDVNFDNTQTQDSQISLYQKDESKDTLYSEADYGSPQAYFEEVSKEYHQEENNVEESSFQVASESTHRTMTTSSAEFQEMKEESSPSQNLEEHYLKQESRSHFENRTHSENVVTSSFEMSEGKFSKKTFEMSELDKQFLMTSEDHLNSKKYSVNSEYEASWSTTLTERIDLCDNLASRFMEGDDELGQNAAMGMSLHAEDKMSSSSSEVAQLDDFDNQDVEIREASEETSEETDVEDQFSPVVKQTDESSFSFEPDVQLHHKQVEFIPEKEKHPDKDLLFDSNVEDRFLDERETSFLEEEEVEDFDHTELEPELCVLALGDEQEREDELEISEHPSGFEGVSSSEDKGLDDENIHKFDIVKDQESKRTLVKQETRDISPEDLEEKPLKSDFPDDYMLDSTDHYQELIFQTQYEMSYAESQQYETYKTMYEIKETLDEEEETEEPSDDAVKEKMTNKQSLEDIVPENEDEQLEASGGADVPATPDEDIDLSSKSSSDSGGVEVFDEQTGTYSRLPWEIAHQYKRQFSESFNEEQKACVKAQKSIDLGTFYRRDRTKDEDFMERSFYDEADTSDIITVAKRKVTFELKHEESGNTVVSEEEEEVQPKDESLCEPYECIDATHEADVISTILESRQKVKHEIARQVFDQEYPDTPKQDSQFQVASSTYTHQTLFDETEEDFTYVQRSEELYTYSEVNERVSVVSRESRMAQQELLLQESFDEEDRSLSPSRDKSCKKLSTTFEETISVIPPPHPTHFPMAVHSVGKSLADNEIYESSETERDSTEEKLSPIEETPGIDDIEEEDTTLKSTPPLEKRVTFQTDRLTTRASEQSVDDFKASSSSSELSVEPTLLAASYDLESGSVFHIVTAYDISPDTVEKQGPIEMAGKSILSSPEDDVFETDSTSPQRTHDSLSSDTPAFILYGHLLSGAGICSSPPIPLPPVSTPREGSSEKVDLSSHLLSASSKLEMLKHTERLDSKDGEDTTLQEDDMSSPHEEEIAITEMQSTEASPESEDNLDKLMDEETIQNGLLENFDNGAVPLNQSTEASVNVNAFPCVLNGPTEVHYIPEYDGGDDDIATVILPGAQPVISFLQRDFSPPSHEDIIEPEMSSSYEAKPDIQQPEEEEEETREVEELIHPSYALTRHTAPDSEKYEEENIDYADSIMPTVISFVLAKPDIQQPEEEVNVEMEEPLQATIMTTSQAKPDIQQPEDKEDVPDGEEIIQPSIMTTSQAKPDIQQPTEDQGNGHPVVEDPVQSSIVNVTQMSPTQYLWEQVGSSGYKISQEFVDEEDAQALKQEKDLLSLSSGEDEDLRNLAEQEESLSPYSAEKEELEEVAYEFSKETVYHGKRALDVDIADMTFSGAYEEQEDAYQQDYAVCGAEPAVEHESAQQEGEEEIEEEEEFEERPEEELIRLEEPPTETDDDTEENLKSHDIKEEKSEVESFEHSSADFLRVGVHSDLDRPLSPTPDALRQGFFGGNFTPPQGGAFTPPQSGMFTPPISDIQTPPHLSHEHETISEEAVVIEQTASTFVESILEDVKTQVSSQECSPETEMEHQQIDEFDSSNYVIDDSKTEDYNNEYQSLDKFSDSEKRRGITLVKQISEDIPGIVLTQYLHQEMNEDEFYGYSPQNENISEDEEDNYEEELEIQETSLDDKESKLDQTEEKNIQDTASHPMLLNLQESDLQSTEGQSETPTEQKLSEFSQEAAFDQKLDSFLEQYTPSTGLGLTEAFQSTALEDQIFFNQDPQYGFEDGSESVDLYMSQEDHADTSSVDSFATVVAAEAEDTDNYEPDENRLAEIASMTSSFTSDIHVPITEDSQKETSDDVGDTEDDDTSMETSQEWTSVVSEEKDRESDASIDSDRFEFVDRAALSIITEMSDEDKFEMIEREDLESEAGLSDQFGSSPDNNIQQSPGISTFRFFGRGTDRDDASISSSLAEFEQMEKAIPFSSSLSSLERDIDKECFGGSYDERKFVGFPRLRGEDSTSIASSLAEFEHLEQVLVVSSSASSVEKQTPESKSSGGSGDNTSNSISSSLADFEKIEQDCQADSDEKKSSVESSCRQSEASSYTSLNEFERLEREIAVASELEVEAQKIVSILESGVLMGSAQFGSSDFSDVGAGDEDDGGQEDIDHDSLSEGGRLYHDVDGDSLDGESSEITEMASSVVFAGPELVASQPILDLDNDSLQGEALMQLSSDSLILEQRMKTSDSAKFDTDSLIFDTDSLFEQEDRMVRSADSLELGGQSGHSSAGGQSGHSSAGPSSEKREEKMVQIEDQMQTSADSLELDNSKEETKEEANKESHLEDSLMMGSMESAAWSMGSSGGTGQSMSESHTDSSQSHDIMQVSTESDILKANAKSAFSVEQRSEIITEETHHYSKSETFQWCQEDTSVQYISEGAHPFPTHFDSQSKYKRKSKTQSELEEFLKTERQEKMDLKSKAKRESPKFFEEDPVKEESPFLSWGPYQETKKVYTMVEWEEMKRLKREKQEQEARAAAQSSSSPDLSQDSQEDRLQSSSSQSPPSVKMTLTSSSTYTSTHSRGERSGYEERTSGDEDDGGDGKPEGDDQYSSGAHGDDDDVQTHRLMMKKEVHKKTTIGLDGQEHTTIREDSQVQQDNEPPEELRESMQEIINQFMESDPQPAHLLPAESKEDEV
ncbi:microtubule-associated protein futsch, partial [Biomphalaria glabrata]